MNELGSLRGAEPEKAPPSPYDALLASGKITKIDMPDAREAAKARGIADALAHDTKLADGVSDMADILAQFVDFPKMFDGFTEHDERRKWINSLDTELRTLADSNRMRLNVINNALLPIQMLPSLLEREHPQAAAALTPYTEHAGKLSKILNSQSYDALPIDKKAELSDTVKDLAAKVLLVLQQNLTRVTHQ